MKLIAIRMTHRKGSTYQGTPMKTPPKLFILAFLLICGGLISGVAQAQDQITTAAETTESVIPELAGIVVLCATEQEKKFKEEWAKYVAHNDLKGRELQKTIKQVSNDAELYRAKKKKSKRRTAEGRNWKSEQRKNHEGSGRALSYNRQVESGPFREETSPIFRINPTVPWKKYSKKLLDFDIAQDHFRLH